MILLEIALFQLSLLLVIALRIQQHYFRAYIAAVQMFPHTHDGDLRAIYLMQRFPVPQLWHALYKRSLENESVELSILVRRPQG